MTYAQKRARGICARCPAPSPLHALCFDCRLKDSAKRKRQYQAAKVARARATVGRVA